MKPPINKFVKIKIMLTHINIHSEEKPACAIPAERFVDFHTDFKH